LKQYNYMIEYNETESTNSYSVKDKQSKFQTLTTKTKSDLNGSGQD